MLTLDISGLPGLSEPTADGKLCLQGETLHTGAPAVCRHCGNQLKMKIFEGIGESANDSRWRGYFIGAYCPGEKPDSIPTLVTRETWLLRSKSLAEIILRVFRETGVLFYKRTVI